MSHPVTDRFKKEWRERPDLFLIFGGIAALVVVVSIAWLVDVAEERKWNAFADQHHCKVVGKTSPTSSVAINPMPGQGVSPVTIVNTPGQTGWQCDDGVTYWR